MALRTVLARGARSALPLAAAASAPALRTAAPARAASSAASAGPARGPAASAAGRAGSFGAAAAATALATAAGLAAGVAYAAAPGNPAMSAEEIAAVTAAIEELLDDNDEMGPTIVRLAWHASGTYDKMSGTGGSDGATMRFAPEAGHGANAGLHHARDALEPIKKLFPDVTYADLWTLAGVVAIEHMGGPKVAWKPGRRDAADETECTPDGRLPDADKGGIGKTVRHVRDIFYRQGFNDREIVALLGAHALGRCYTDRSGYKGPWTFSPTTFSNSYFKLLLEETWVLKQWDGPDQFEDSTGELMMLPADMAIIWDKEFRKYVVEFARDEEMFFKEFAAAFQKLEENGVKSFANGSAAPWYKFW